ncbi:hypothetical protein [Desertivirga arenae]|uniref:hypothetical protein n=1 Tax=Desertivirga arenae TaxID=2810309 RepID=UPI001A9593E4|nr:hypothetical protein [Pedobacter sp. SYSU D00823]
METRFLRVLLVVIAASFGNACSSGGNQGMNEAGSADSDSMVNIDTQWVDTTGAAQGGNGKAMDQGGLQQDTTKGPGKVPVPSP